MEPTAPPEIIQMEAKKDIKGLIAALSYEKWVARDAAIFALGRLGDPQAVEPLIGILKGTDISLCVDAADALGLIGDKRAFEPLLEVYKQKNTLFNIPEVLIKFGDPRAIEPLMAVFLDPNKLHPLVREAAAWALLRLGDASVKEQVFTILKKGDITDAAASGSPRLVEMLLMAGVNVDTRTSPNGGYTPLLIAAGRGRTDVVKILLEAGADVNARGGSGKTAYQLAMERDYGETGAVIQEYAKAKGIKY